MKNLLFYFICIFSSITNVHPKTEWIDPFDMTIGVPQGETECICEEPTIYVMMHYKRVINLLLASVAVDRTDQLNYKGHLLINIPIESYDFLRDFATSSSEDPEMLQKINIILNNIFVRPTIEDLSNMLISWSDYVYFTFFNRTTGILITVLFILFISYKLLRANFTLWSVVKYLLFLGWIVDYSFIWMRLLQEQEINKIADSLRYVDIPPHCDPKKMSYWQYFWSSISGEDECRKYHSIHLGDIYWNVSPFVVFSHQFEEIIVKPASYLGSAVSGFTSGVIGGLPFPLNIILLPFLLIFTLILMCIILSFITKTSFGFNFFYLMQFKFGMEDRKALRDVISGENVSKLLDAMAHRPIIENVEQKISKKKMKINEPSCSDVKQNIQKRGNKRNDLNGKTKIKEITAGNLKEIRKDKINVKNGSCDHNCADLTIDSSNEFCLDQSQLCSDQSYNIQRRRTKTNGINGKNKTKGNTAGDLKEIQKDNIDVTNVKNDSCDHNCADLTIDSSNEYLLCLDQSCNNDSKNNGCYSS